jgi:hypothetical protein
MLPVFYIAAQATGLNPVGEDSGNATNLAKIIIEGQPSVSGILHGIVYVCFVCMWRS